MKIETVSCCTPTPADLSDYSNGVLPLKPTYTNPVERQKSAASF